MDKSYVVFARHLLIARGSMSDIIRRLHPRSDEEVTGILILDESSGKPVDIDWRGDVEAVVERATLQERSTVKGRPRLGVEGREITLLPRHWKWLESRGRSASAEIRSLVDAAMRKGDAARGDVDAVYWQMSALAGNLPDFEEAVRHLYSGELKKAVELAGAWPGDVGEYLAERLRSLAENAE